MNQTATQAAETSTGNVTLEVAEVSKAFGNVVALWNASIHARAGEVTAIVGDNGAGKSTLIKCISGVHPPDSGEVRINGKPTQFRFPEDARQAGIETVYQDLALVEDLTIWENLFLNRERTKGAGPFKFLDKATMRDEAEEMLSRLQVHIPTVKARVRRLSGGQRQAVSIARAAGWGSKIVIMDEPTAALGVRETARVEELIERLRADGLAVIVISHNFEQVMRISQQVWVMRRGRVTAGMRTSDTTGQDLVAFITGAKGPDVDGQAAAK
ncbi:MAG TPA: ATP-binding cassette domain-containing protein [Actinomycetota bacterium]|nr:ATP-binding cassette domain-containing protein [Actinomycetota bacterium]